jgi:hypothetical protein
MLLRVSGVVMTNYGTLLRDHVTLQCRSIDRIFLQVYVPRLQTVGEGARSCASSGSSRFLLRRHLVGSAMNM